MSARFSVYLCLMLLSLSMIIACGQDEAEPAPTPTRVILTLENISTDQTFTLSTGEPLTVAFAPGFYAVTDSPEVIFSPAKNASPELELLAETGDPSGLLTSMAQHERVTTSGPLGDTDNLDYKESPILPGKKAIVILELDASKKLVVAMMLGPSNDTFVGTQAEGVPLSELNVEATTDITDKFQWWDAGTEVNEPIGEGPNQVSNAPGTDSGQTEAGTVQQAPLKGAGDAPLLPPLNTALRVTVEPY